MLRRVDLPQPEGPMIATNSPVWISKETLLRAIVSTRSVRKIFLRFFISILAMIF